MNQKQIAAQWESYLRTNLAVGGQDEALRWIAAHLGRMSEELRAARKRIRALERKINKGVKS